MDWDWTRRIFDHVEVSASDYAESVRFYETVLGALDIPRIGVTDDWTCFTNLNVVDRRPPTTDLHLCFIAHSREEVDGFHAAGVGAGFRSNGTPGYREYGAGLLRRVPPRSRREQRRSAVSRRRERRPWPYLRDLTFRPVPTLNT